MAQRYLACHSELSYRKSGSKIRTYSGSDRFDIETKGIIIKIFELDKDPSSGFRVQALRGSVLTMEVEETTSTMTVLQEVTVNES